MSEDIGYSCSGGLQRYVKNFSPGWSCAATMHVLLQHPAHRFHHALGNGINQHTEVTARTCPSSTGIVLAAKPSRQRVHPHVRRS